MKFANDHSEIQSFTVVTPFSGEVILRSGGVSVTGEHGRRPWPARSFLARLLEAIGAGLLRGGTVLTVPANRILIHQGDPGRSVYLLLDALVKITVLAENGLKTLLAIRADGDIVGEMSPLDDCPRSATVTTCRKSTVCVIKGATFLAHLDREPQIARVLSRITSDRLRFANRRRLAFTGYEADVCLARVLLDLSDRYGLPCRGGLDVGVPLTQVELGELTGFKERTVQKAVHHLVSRGLILTSHRQVVITDLDGLTAFADLSR